MASEFKCIRRVEFADTDMAGIMHFANFFRMMEVTEHAFFRSLGFSIQEHDDEGRVIGWPRVSVTCDFSKPLRFEEEVEIHLAVREVRSRSIRYDYVFRKLPDRMEVARGSMAVVCAAVNQATGKLAAIPIPDRIRSKIEAAPPEALEESPVPPVVAN